MLRTMPPAPPAAMIEFERVSIRHRTPHASRCSGTPCRLKKRLGLSVASVKEERGRVYRIAEPASV